MVKVYLKSYPTLIYYNGFSFNRIDFYFGLILQSRAKLAEQEARMSLLRGMASNRMTNEQKEELERITPAKFVKSSEEPETEIVPSTRCLKSKYRF